MNRNSQVLAGILLAILGLFIWRYIEALPSLGVQSRPTFENSIQHLMFVTVVGTTTAASPEDYQWFAGTEKDKLALLNFRNAHFFRIAGHRPVGSCLVELTCFKTGWNVHGLRDYYCYYDSSTGLIRSGDIACRPPRILAIWLTATAEKLNRKH